VLAPLHTRDRPRLQGDAAASQIFCKDSAMPLDNTRAFAFLAAGKQPLPHCNASSSGKVGEHGERGGASKDR
jgi:hypothetical protein